MSIKPTPRKAMPKKPAKAATPVAERAVAPVEVATAEPVIAEPLSTQSAMIETTAAPAPASPPSAFPPETPAETPIATKEPTMTATFPTFDVTAFKTAFDDMAARAQTAYADAYAKGTAAFGEANEFAKGNAEALVEVSKLFAAGVETLASEFVADSKTTYETLSTDAKALAAAKSPAELVTLQSELVKKHFDTAVAYGSKSSETLLKLAGDIAAPISNRVSLAVEKVKVAA